MLELNNKIARLEMLIEQHVIHLEECKGRASEEFKAHLLDMLHQLRWYKEERAGREAECGTVEQAA